MSHRTIALALCALLLAAAGFGPAAMASPRPGLDRGATDFSAQQRLRRAPPRFTVHPYSRLYRQCVDWYAVEARASGPTVVPQMRCWWVRR
jgi:hypothetical protein